MTSDMLAGAASALSGVITGWLLKGVWDEFKSAKAWKDTPLDRRAKVEEGRAQCPPQSSSDIEVQSLARGTRSVQSQEEVEREEELEWWGN